MVEPQDSKEEEKKAQKKSHQAWLTANGFQVTGLHRSTERDYLRLLPTGAATELTEVHRQEEQGVRWGLPGTFLLTYCSHFRSGGKTHCLLMCCSLCWTETGGAGTGAIRTLICTRSHRLSSSCPLLHHWARNR